MPTLNWIGKDKVVTHHLDVPCHVLDHKYGFRASNPSDKTPTDSGNLIIHGDNLLALKALLPQYEGRVKCIYIDPPYNTGNEKWVYNDNVNDPRIRKWLGEVVGVEGEDLSRHDKWLCMMYPRLQLLRQLLSEDGVIFISINFQNEYSNLRLILNEIFGTNNYIGTLTWESTTQPTNAGSAKFGLQNKVEPILFYSKNRNALPPFILNGTKHQHKYQHMGRFGPCRFEIIEKSDAGGYKRDSMRFPILGIYPRQGKRWQIGKETADALVKAGRIEIVDGVIKKAIYPEDEAGVLEYIPFWSHYSAKEVGTAQSGKDKIKNVFEKEIGFDTVKPTDLLKSLFSHLDPNAIILDSFAGSGTTAHAVMELNKKDGGNRRFILIELMDYADSITAERVKRVAQGYGTGNKYVEGLGGEFDFYELGAPIFNEDGNLNEDIGKQRIREYIYYSETRQALTRAYNDGEYLLDTVNNVSYYLYYEKDALCALTHDTLNIITQKSESYIVYADTCSISKDWLTEHNITFKQIPRDIRRF